MCIIFGNFITVLGVISMILTLFSLKKHSTAAMYAIFFCSAIITVLGVILLTKDNFIPKNSLPIIMGLLGIFLFILSVLQKSQVNTDWDDYKIDYKKKKSLLNINFMVSALSLCLIIGSFINFYFYSDYNDIDDKVSYSFKKIKKLKKQQEEIKLKQDQLKYETQKELEKIKEETSGIISDSPKKSPLIKNEHDQNIELNTSPKKINFSKVLESPDLSMKKESHIQSPNKDYKITSPSQSETSNTPDNHYSRKNYNTPDNHSTPDNGKSSNNDTLESSVLNIKSPKLETKKSYYDELDEIMAKLKAEE